jgi:hypothetical protein
MASCRPDTSSWPHLVLSWMHTTPRDDKVSLWYELCEWMTSPNPRSCLIRGPAHLPPQSAAPSRPVLHQSSPYQCDNDLEHAFSPVPTKSHHPLDANHPVSWALVRSSQPPCHNCSIQQGLCFTLQHIRLEAEPYTRHQQTRRPGFAPRDRIAEFDLV